MKEVINYEKQDEIMRAFRADMEEAWRIARDKLQALGLETSEVYYHLMNEMERFL